MKECLSKLALHVDLNGREDSLSLSADYRCAESEQGAEGACRVGSGPEAAERSVDDGYEAEGKDAWLSVLHDQQLRAWREGVPLQERTERVEDDLVQRCGERCCVPQGAGVAPATLPKRDGVHGRFVVERSDV